MKSLISNAILVLLLSASPLQAAEKTAGDHVDDGWLHTKVKSALIGHGSSDVNVEVYHGVVQLAGFLTGEGNKKNLIAAAQGVEGVQRVSDQLQLVEGDRTAGQVLDDNTLTGKVKAALADNGMIGVNVEVNRGAALLSGFVDNDDARNKAVELARGVSGVARVINGMDLKS
jgi:osmotically-inducible protein OsmY